MRVLSTILRKIGKTGSNARYLIELEMAYQQQNDEESAAARNGGQVKADDRRRHLRFSLGLAVNIHVHGRPDPVTVQMVDIAVQGVRFRLADGVASGKVRVEQRAAFGFVSPGRHVCVASGTITRVAGQDEFVLSIDRANDAYHGFLGSLGQ